MRQETVYFLQALAEGGVSYDLANQILKQAFLSEINRSCAGVQQSDTLWISEGAKQTRMELESLCDSLDRFSKPSQLLPAAENFQKLLGKLQGMQICTIQSLNSRQGPTTDQLHILVPQLFNMARTHLESQISSQIYRAVVLGGVEVFNQLSNSLPATVQEQITFYLNVLEPLLEGLDDHLDGRWAYERRKVKICGKFIINQYVNSTVKEDELAQIPGRCAVGTGAGGDMRITGRGSITNLSPGRIKQDWKPHVMTRIPKDTFFKMKDIRFKNPNEILDGCFQNRNYLISPKEYFQVYNKYLIAETMFQRYHRGNCLFCGGMILGDKCSECGERK